MATVTLMTLVAVVSTLVRGQVPVGQGAGESPVDAEDDVHGDTTPVALDPGDVDLEIADAIPDLVEAALVTSLPLGEDDEVGVAGLEAGGVARVLVASPVLDVDDASDAIEDVVAAASLARDPVHLDGQRGREGGARGLDDDAVGLHGVAELGERGRQLADQVAADAPVQQLLHARDGAAGRELRVDGHVAELVLEQREAVRGVGGAQLRDEVEEQRGLARAQEPGDDGDGNRGHLFWLSSSAAAAEEAEACVLARAGIREREKRESLSHTYIYGDSGVGSIEGFKRLRGFF